MLYRFAKVVMWLSLHFYFRRIVFSGRERIPAKGPAILIANHSASFLDAILLAVLLRRPLHFLARSDIFRNPMADRILRAFHMIPIYNIEYGRGEVVRNEETFAEGERVLSGGGLLLIFPEGLSRMERVMLPLKKGTARVALRTEEQNGFRLGLSVIPLGINFSRHAFRADILLQVGAPTPLDAYAETWRLQPARAVNMLTRDLEVRFEETLIHVRQPERTDFINRLLELHRPDVPHPGSADRLASEKRLCETVSNLSDGEAGTAAEVLSRYDSALRMHGLTDASVCGRGRPPAWLAPLLALTAPLFLLSALLNGVPLLASARLAKRTVTRADFHTSVVTAIGGFLYLLWWLLLLAAAAMAGGAWPVASAFSAPALLFLGISWWEAARNLLAHAAWRRLSLRSPAEAAGIRALRSRLSAHWADAAVR